MNNFKLICVGIQNWNTINDIKWDKEGMYRKEIDAIANKTKVDVIVSRQYFAATSRVTPQPLEMKLQR